MHGVTSTLHIQGVIHFWVQAHAASSENMDFLRRNLLQLSLSITHCSQLNSIARSPLHTQPSPLLYVISASHFLTGNTLYCNVRRWQASKQARTLHVLQSNPFDLGSIMFFTHLAGLSVPLE